MLKADDVLSLPAHRLDNIFRTNIQGAYARGKCAHIEENRTARPYLMYSAINDARTRPAHAAMNGYVAHVDAAVWKTWTPPCGYRCRCTVISLSEGQARERMERDADRLANNPDASAARDAAIQGGPDKGWGYTPCDTVTSDGYRLPVDLDALIQDRARRYGPTLSTILAGLASDAARMFREAWGG
jgi:SPP1 gp7 family putative phage head morphogenesis protein